ncbi:MAG: phage tail tape measure protein, partial [Deltaproteobacteria bacterium]|nr:phage tail tape measure protein [Deltaproteobacteria bacterium]
MAISIGDAVLKIGLDKKDFEHSMSGLVNGIKKHRKAIGLAMTATGAAIVGGLGLALKSAVGFESAMREVNTMIGLSQTEFEEFSKDVQDLSAELGVNAVDSAKALYQAISAGVPKENVLEFLRIATEAAIGGVTDTETAVDGLTTVINAFKLPMSDAQKVADIMFTTVKGGKTTFDELSASMFQVAPIAAASGVSFEEVSGALATMTKQGVPTTVAVTQLRQAMVALQKPTTLMSKTISDLGYETGQAMLEELGFAETIDMLRDSTHGSNEELLTMFGSVEAGAAILALTGDNAQTFADDLDAMTNSTGAATGAFEEMEESAGRQMDSLKAAFSDVAMTVGNVLIPVLTGIVDKIKPIIENIKNWISEHPALTRGIVLVVGAIGGLLLVFGPLLLILPGLIAAFKMFNIITLAAKVATALWTVAQWALNAALTANPIGLIIMAIAALIAIVITVVKKWDELVVFFKKLWSDIKIIFLKGVDKVLGILNAYVGWLPWVGDKVAEARDKISNLIDAERVKQQVERARQEIKEWADDVRDK